VLTGTPLAVILLGSNETSRETVQNLDFLPAVKA
jgi:hypothetical protein